MSYRLYKKEVKPTLSEVSLFVQNLENTALFYEDTLGIKLLSKTKTEAIFTLDGTTPFLTLLERNNFEPILPAETGLFHIAILLPTRKDLGLCLAHLEQVYPNLIGSSDHLYSEAIYLTDPEGNGIEIYADRTPNQWPQDTNGQYITDVAPLDTDSLLTFAKDNSWKGMPSGTTLGHMHLKVANLEESEAFYSSVLGFDVVTRYPGALFLSKNDYHHHIAVNTWLTSRNPLPIRKNNTFGLYQFAIHLPPAEWENTLNQLIGNDYPHDVSDDEIHIKDPSNNGIFIRRNK